MHHVLIGILSAFTGDPEPWVSFANETDTRLQADPAVVAADPEEKDYAWGDVDDDGDIDLVIVRKEPQTAPGRRRNVLLMNENGVLVDRTAELATLANDGGMGFLDETADRDVQLVDLNFDGRLDIVTAVAHGQGLPKTISHSRVYMNLGPDGDGVWQGFMYDEPRIPELAGAPNAAAVAAGDVTGDHAVELFYATYQGSEVDDHLLLNDETGFFTDVSAERFEQPLLALGFGINAEIVDMNDDGWRDIVRCLGGSIDVMYNDGGGVFILDRRDNISGFAHYSMSTGDLDGDGSPDVIAPGDASDFYLINDGAVDGGMADFDLHVFTHEGGGFDDGFTGNSIAADLQGDGFNDVLIADVDILLAGCLRRTHIYQNLGDDDTTLVEQQIDDRVADIPIEMLAGTHDIAVFDIDGDGFDDLVLGRCDSTEIWINQACAADANGDGVVNVLDLVIVILAWSSDDDAADINNDGVVDVLDLLQVILNHGPC